jgi:hypothetical protein
MDSIRETLARIKKSARSVAEVGRRVKRTLKRLDGQRDQRAPEST